MEVAVYCVCFTVLNTNVDKGFIIQETKIHTIVESVTKQQRNNVKAVENIQEVD